jgi:hypothetical protein
LLLQQQYQLLKRLEIEFREKTFAINTIITGLAATIAATAAAATAAFAAAVAITAAVSTLSDNPIKKHPFIKL